MEPITLAAIAVFLSPFLTKAGEKVTEKTVESLFESRADLADKFKGLFKDEIITLGLNDAVTTQEIAGQLEAKPEVQESVRRKVADNQELINKLTEALSKQEGRTITCKTYIENIKNIENAHF